MSTILFKLQLVILYMKTVHLTILGNFCETESYRLESSFFFDYSETDTKIGCNIKWTERKRSFFLGSIS